MRVRTVIENQVIHSAERVLFVSDVEKKTQYRDIIRNGRASLRPFPYRRPPARSLDAFLFRCLDKSLRYSARF